MNTWKEVLLLRGKINYQKELDKLLGGLESKPRLLLHACCAPCSSYVLEYLPEYFEVSLFFYNPNIQPRSEYEKRLYWLRVLLERMRLSESIPIIEAGRQGERFSPISAGLEKEPEGGARCTSCFQLRLGETAKYAEKNGFSYFTSTLTISPHKDAVRINTIGEGLSCTAKWLPSDFKKREGYKRSIELCREYEIYRQDYCGCLFSKNTGKITDNVV